MSARGPRYVARLSGETHYFTGKPCTNGHIAMRVTESGSCVECRVGIMGRWRAKNLEQVQAYEAAYREARKISDPDYWAREYAKSTEYYKQKASDWYYRNRSRALEANRAWMRNNAERRRLSHALWVAANLSAIRGRQKRRRSDPERYAALLALNASRRAKMRGCDGQYTPDDINRLVLKQGGKCPICTRRLGKKRHVDHIMPLWMGGSNDPSNLQITHPRCNLKKGRSDPFWYAQNRLGRLL